MTEHPISMVLYEAQREARDKHSAAVLAARIKLLAAESDGYVRSDLEFGVVVVVGDCRVPL